MRARPAPPLLPPDEPLVILDRLPPADRAFLVALPSRCPELVPFVGYCGDLTPVLDQGLCARLLAGGSEQGGEPGGVRPVTDASEGDRSPESAVCIHNLTYGFRRPCVLYVRVNVAGAVGTNDFRQQTLEVAAAKLYDHCTASFKDLPDFVDGARPSDLSQITVSYLRQARQAAGSPYVAELLAGFEEEFEALASGARSADVRLGSCVVAMVYEADPFLDVTAPSDVVDVPPVGRPPSHTPGDDPESEDDSEEDVPSMLDVKLLDFQGCLWCPGEGPDNGFLTALGEITKTFGRSGRASSGIV